ncbi:SHOCT domain-containing protein [Mycetocola zhadangensis]|uniref:SHOCT domain-containing protein n=1 Tax=Mycetocola zhadangensis TaxID=1164595 RepID=UPI003A4DCEB4
MNLIFDFLWVLLTLVAVVLVVVGVTLVVLSVRSRRNPPKPAANKPVPVTHSIPIAHTAKERLQELEALRAAGTITPEEHAARRDAILREL